MESLDSEPYIDNDGDLNNEDSQLNSEEANFILSCERCGRQGYARGFYGKKKQYCSFSCSRPSVMAKKIQQKKNQHRVPGSHDWRSMLDSVDFHVTSVASFKHAPLSEWWARNVTIGMKVEVQNHDAPENIHRVVYWVATICDIKGYYVKLRYVGFDNDTADFWANLCYVQEEDTHIVDLSVHHVGWCAFNDKPLVPPKTIEDKTENWKEYMVQKLTGSKTLPHNFQNVVREKLRSRLEIGMKLEAIDKTRLSSLRVAVVNKIIGRRVYVKYERMEEDDEGFWFHEKSSMIHPIGWARVHGHELLSTEDYARQSLAKALTNKFGPKEASWIHIPPLELPESVVNVFETNQFEVGMKLEVIDPLNLSTICVGTVHKLLRNNYLMIGVDGATHPNGSDLMCYHASSPYIFPVGFCKLYNLDLQPPHLIKRKDFNWDDYLRETKGKAAPFCLFKRGLPNHDFKAGQYLEAVDLMDPKLICVARVTHVVDRLVRIHFEGWSDEYDQWVDCDSPDIFPVGWCDVVEYMLTPPNPAGEGSSGTQNSSKKKRETNSSGRRKKRKLNKGGSNGKMDDLKQAISSSEPSNEAP